MIIDNLLKDDINGKKQNVNKEPKILKKGGQIMNKNMFKKIICFVNLKSYFDNAELIELYKYAIYNKVAILLVESSMQDVALDYERKLIIDNEFDEFTVNF